MGLTCITNSFRFLSTKPKKGLVTKIALIKNLNFENKSLFGPVRKKAANLKTEPKINVEESNKDSEIYWLINHKLEKNIVASDSDNKRTVKNKDNSSRKTISQKSSTTSNAIINPIIVSNENVIPLENAIPFNPQELRDVLKYPMIYEPKTKLLTSSTINFETVDIPSVGKILQATMPDAARKALMKWKVSKIAELGEEGFNTLQKNNLESGAMFHGTLHEFFINGNEPATDSPVYDVWKSVSPVLNKLKPEIQYSEVPIEHPYLRYRGIADCVSIIGSELSVVEWKKSHKLKNQLAFTYDAPIQLCAYLGALSADERYKLVPKKGFVVVAYTDGRPGQIHSLEEVDLKKYWQNWLCRLQEFWIRTRDGTLPEPI